MAPRKSAASRSIPKKNKKGTTHPDGKIYFKGECVLREKVERGKTLYLVKYKGYNTEYAQWQPWKNVGSDLLEDWENEKEVVEVDEYWEGKENSSDKDEDVASDDSESEDDKDSTADNESENEQETESNIEMDDDTSSLSSELCSPEGLDGGAEGDVEMEGAEASSEGNQAGVDLEEDQLSPHDVGFTEFDGIIGEYEESGSQESWETVDGYKHAEEANDADLDMMRDETEDEPSIAEDWLGTAHLQHPSGKDITAAEDGGVDAFSEATATGIVQILHAHSPNVVDEAPARNDEVRSRDSYYVTPDAGLKRPDFIREPGPTPTLTQILERDVETAQGERPHGIEVEASIKGIDEWLPEKVLG